MTILKGDSIFKSFQDGKIETQVLHGVSLDLARGEVVILEGPSGSGKTTLLQILGCIMSPTKGTIEINGRPVAASRSRELASIRKKNLGFVFQQFNLFPALTVLENVEYALNIKGIDGKEARRQAQGLVDAVELTNRANYLPRDLSGGQKQRVAIARAMAGKPPVILADEPTANLDTQVGAQILALFNDLAKRENRGLLIVTHDPKVRTIADRVIQIRDGFIHAA
jgi:putative ABC transport system ATP-binding protein